MPQSGLWCGVPVMEIGRLYSPVLVLTIRYTSVALMHALGDRRFSWLANRDATPAVEVTLLRVGGFVSLSVRGLRRMGVSVMREQEDFLSDAHLAIPPTRAGV